MKQYVRFRWFSFMLLAGLMTVARAQAAAPGTTTWQFTFSGQDAGTGTATVDSQGVIRGAGHSSRFDMDVTLTGQVDADGALSLTATPTGATSSGALFTGQLSGDTASGSWRNDDAGLSGTWTARQGTSGPGTSGGSQQVHCRIDGDEFDATPPIVPDVMIPPKGDRWMFRLIAGHGLGLAPNGDRTDVEAKAVNVTHAGAYDMSLEPTWRSTSLVKGRNYRIDRGTINLTTYNPRGDGRAAGSLSFDAQGHHGQCTFNVLLTVQDMARLMGSAPH